MNLMNTDTYNASDFQHTLKDSFTCVSRGLHTGLKIVMRVTPGDENTGIVFVRRDVEFRRSEIQASWQNVSDTRLSTTIANKRGIRVSTVEHIMAALYASGIDNARILLDGPEVPIMDGSAASFVSLINQVGKVQQNALRNAIIIKQTVSVTKENKFACFHPAPIPWMEVEIDFGDGPIGNQRLTAPISSDAFENELAPARTFGFMEHLSTLHNLGLARGSTLQNAIVIDDGQILNKEGLRFEDEFVRHKMVDAIGDIALTGARIIGHFSGYCSGHELNHALIQKIMANEHSWQYTTLTEAKNYWREMMQLPYTDEELARDIMSKFDLYAN